MKHSTVLLYFILAVLCSCRNDSGFTHLNGRWEVVDFRKTAAESHQLDTLAASFALASGAQEYIFERDSMFLNGQFTATYLLRDGIVSIKNIAQGSTQDCKVKVINDTLLIEGYPLPDRTTVLLKRAEK